MRPNVLVVANEDLLEAGLPISALTRATWTAVVEQSVLAYVPSCEKPFDIVIGVEIKIPTIRQLRSLCPNATFICVDASAKYPSIDLLKERIRYILFTWEAEHIAALIEEIAREKGA